MQAKVIDFWFSEIEPKQWWIKDPQFDLMIKDRFGALHLAATQGELASWRSSALGRLAEVIILDQFSRNIYRDDPRAFAFDGMALVLAQECLRQQQHLELTLEQRRFLYMPFMHSESLVIHETAEKLFTEPGLEGNLDFERQHKRIIERFGRYPHRNQILARTSTPEELLFLSEPGSSF